MKRNKRPPANTGEWLNTYADMVTLLLCFFVLLFSMSTILDEKWMAIISAFNPDSIVLKEYIKEQEENEGNSDEEPLEPSDVDKEEADAAFDALYEAISDYIAENNLSDSVQLYKEEGYIFINFQDHVFFDGDSSVLRPDGQAILNVLGNALNGMDGYVGLVRVMGHTTQKYIDRPNDIYPDRQLSSDRSMVVTAYMEEMGVIDGKKIVAESYGQHYPVAPFDTEENNMKNRRVDILISKSGEVEYKLEEIYAQLGLGTDG
jgi:chemotaxis protein MotB